MNDKTPRPFTETSFEKNKATALTHFGCPLHALTLHDLTTPGAMHLSVRASEKRLASAPERAVPSHGHIDHELNLRRSLSMSQHPVPGCSESAAAACAGTRRHPSALMPTELALCGADARVSLAPAQPPPPAGLASTFLVIFSLFSSHFPLCSFYPGRHVPVPY